MKEISIVLEEPEESRTNKSGYIKTFYFGYLNDSKLWYTDNRFYYKKESFIMSYKKILTIQDISCVGQCSLTVALPILSACGIETCVLPSAVLSTHTAGFSGYTFRDLTEDMPAINEHWKKEGIKFSAIYTGYLGSTKQIEYVEQIFDDAAAEGCVKVVDPAMADNGKLYPGFDEAFVEAMKDLCGKADYIVPNITEACFLTGMEYKTEYDREDLFLSRQQRESKQLSEFILNQEPVLTEYSKMTGFFNCDSSVVGDAFHRIGHKVWEEVRAKFYLKAIDNLSTLEWQHATADYQKVLDKGIRGIIEEIDESLKIHTETEEAEFLNALKCVANALIGWAHKCSRRALEFSRTVEHPEYKANLERLAATLLKVPHHGKKSDATEAFVEAVQPAYGIISIGASKLPADDTLSSLQDVGTMVYRTDLNGNILCNSDGRALSFEMTKTEAENENG